MRISDWSSDVCSSDLIRLLSGEEEAEAAGHGVLSAIPDAHGIAVDLGGGSLELAEVSDGKVGRCASFPLGVLRLPALRSEEHTSELQSLMRTSYAVFCLKKKINTIIINIHASLRTVV